jgi:hypothetical protein
MPDAMDSNHEARPQSIIIESAGCKLERAESSQVAGRGQVMRKQACGTGSGSSPPPSFEAREARQAASH